jgi:DNA (cytosine-5)-methyltransferase 1
MRTSQPLATIVADGSNHALVEPMLVPVESRDGVRARPVSGPARAQTTRLQDALVVPLRNNGVARPSAEHPLPTFAACGQHHALVMRNNNGWSAGAMSTSVEEPIRTLTANCKQSLVQWGHHALYAYDTGEMRPLGLPLPTQTTVQGDALVGTAFEVDDCTLRMLDVHEIAWGMAFLPGYEMPFGAKRDKIKGLGNSVTPPASRDLLAMLVEAITGQAVAR